MRTGCMLQLVEGMFSALEASAPLHLPFLLALRYSLATVQRGIFRHQMHLIFYWHMYHFTGGETEEMSDLPDEVVLMFSCLFLDLNLDSLKETKRVTCSELVSVAETCLDANGETSAMMPDTPVVSESLQHPETKRRKGATWKCHHVSVMQIMATLKSQAEREIFGTGSGICRTGVMVAREEKAALERGSWRNR